MGVYKAVSDRVASLVKSGELALHSASQSELLVTKGVVLNGNHWVELVVYPTDNLYRATQFNVLLSKLRLNDEKVQFKQTDFSRNHHQLKFGNIHFFENIGEIRVFEDVRIRLNDNDDIFEKNQFSRDNLASMPTRTSLTRRVSVYLVPTKEIAEILYPKPGTDLELLPIPMGLSQVGMSGKYLREYLATNPNKHDASVFGKWKRKVNGWLKTA